jgi:hypothetical protein
MRTMVTMALVCGNDVRMMSWEEKVIDLWDNLVWVIGASTTRWLTWR